MSKIGARKASVKNAPTSWAVTSGGSRLSVSTASRRGLCRDMSSSAGCKKSVEGGGLTVGLRYIRRRVRKTEEVGVLG